MKKIIAGADKPVNGKTRDPITGFWKHPITINENNFIDKSLSIWACNIAIGCNHGCRFCYVPDTSARKQKPELKKHGVEDPDAQWGQYVFLREWDEKAFLASLKVAENTPIDPLKTDGNRAVIFCSTTDAYQVICNPDAKLQRELNAKRQTVVRRALELIRDHATINVRILTRNLLAEQDFPLFKTFGNRLLFGVSLPTLNDKLARIYEPNVPSPTRRLQMLHKAKQAGLNVFVALAPTYPECDEADLRATLTAVRELNPVTVFHEPINVRAENVERIAAHARSLGETINTSVFATPLTWRRYALESLTTVERLASEIGLMDRLKLWPDADLATKSHFMDIRRQAWQKPGLTKKEKAFFIAQDEVAYGEFLAWLQGWWSRISDWPGYAEPNRMLQRTTETNTNNINK